MKKKIFIYYLILVVIGISVTGFFTSELTQKFYKHEVEEKLKNVAILIRHHISVELTKGKHLDYNSIAIDYASLLSQSSSVHNASEKTSFRITIIDFNGNVLGESGKDYHDMGNHLNRKEIKDAVAGKIGEDERFSQTLKVNFLYIAIPLESQKIIVRVSVKLVELETIDRIIWYYTIIGILLGLLLTVILALKFSTSITKPVVELIEASKEISRGNYSKRVNINTQDELQQLSDTFNEMAFVLDKTVAELKDKNVKVESIMNSMISGIVAVDCKYRIILINSIALEMFGLKQESDAVGNNILETIRNSQINNLLKDTLEKNTSLVNEIMISSAADKILRIYTNPIRPNHSVNSNSGGIIFIQDITNIKKLEQIRTEFVSNVTHELKTPLTSIRGFIETLRNGAIQDKNVADKFLEIIDIEAERLYMLINDILQLSEIESKQKDNNIGTHNLDDIINEVVSILQGVSDKKGISLHCHVEPNIKIVANRDRIKQMLINLIDNGIKYNKDGGSVTVHGYKKEGKIFMVVKDTGIGIAAENLPRIFERFYRVDKGRSRNMGGTGLGLSIVKHIVNLYSGDIKVNSEPGVGTEFIIQLVM